MEYFGGFFAGIFVGFSLYIINKAVRVSEAAMGRGARSAQFGVACPKRRVRAAHGRKRAAKTH